MMQFSAARASFALSLTYGVGGCRWNEASIGAQVAAGGEQFLFVMRLIALPAPTSVQSLAVVASICQAELRARAVAFAPFR